VPAARRITCCRSVRRAILQDRARKWGYRAYSNRGRAIFGCDPERERGGASGYPRAGWWNSHKAAYEAWPATTVAMAKEVTRWLILQYRKLSQTARTSRKVGPNSPSLDGFITAVDPRQKKSAGSRGSRRKAFSDVYGYGKGSA